MLRKALLILGSLFIGVGAYATHMSGGEIYWECIGPNQYRIRLLVYRDCAGINVDPSYNLVLTSPCGNRNLTVSTNGGTELSQLCDLELPNSTCNGGTLPGIQQYIYTGTITLPPCDSWRISWTNIYRNNAIVNLTAPGTRQMFIESVMNNALAPCNDSPTFTNTAIPYVCLGYPVSYSYGAVDSDADSLSYSLIGARMINGSGIPYVPPYTPFVPIPGLTLDPVTGQLNFTLFLSGNWVVVVLVTEFDANGNVIGSIMRDMQFVAYPCSNVPPAAATGLVTNLTGSAIQTGPRAVQVCESGDFCFDMVISDVNATNVLEAFTNVQQNLPGSTFTYTGTNPITARLCWNAQPGTAGFYPIIVNVSDGACPIPAFQTYVYSVTVLSGLAATVAVVDETCAGDGSGTAAAIVTVGTAPFIYAWNTGALDSMIIAGAGNYSVEITDANGCSSGALPAVIGADAQPNQANAGADAVNCEAYGPIPLQGTVVNATSGSWSNGSGSFTGLWPNISYTASAGEVLVGGIDLFLTTVGNAGCPPDVDTLHIDLPNSFANIALISTDALCNAGSTGTASVLPNDPLFSFAWNDPGLQTTAAATMLAAGNYAVLITDSFGCDTTLSASIGQPAAIALLSLIATNEACQGSGDGTVTATATGGTAPYTYNWNNGASTAVITAGSGSYTVDISDANGCTPASGTAAITYQGLPNQVDAGTDLIACAGSYPIALSGSVVNATGGSWSGGNGTFSGTWPNINFAPGAIDLATGSAQLILTSTGNTTCPPVTDTLHIDLPNSFANLALTSTDALCNAGSTGTATVAPSDPSFSFAWNDPGLQTTAAATMLAAGNYAVMITDSFGCDTTLTTSIGQPAAIALLSLIATNEACQGSGDGTVTASASGGTAPYTYNWNNGSSAAVITAGSGSYTVGISDANGCTPAIGTATISYDGLPNLAYAGEDLIGCSGTFPISLNGTVTNATSGMWSSGSGTFQGTWPSIAYTPGPTDIANGSVDLTLNTSGNSTCPPASDVLTILLPNSFAAITIDHTDATCNGTATGTATIAPSAGFTLQWTPSAQSGATATNLSAGNYSVLVTDIHGCDTTLSAAIGEPDAISIGGVDSVNETCAGEANGTLIANVSGGTAPYSYTWSNGGNTATITAGAGSYSVSVTDANGCAPATAGGSIATSGQPNIANAGTNLIGCMNAYPIAVQGSVQNATSGTWSGGNGAILGNGLAIQYMPTATEILNGSVQLTLTTIGNTSCPPATDAVVITLSNAFLNAALTADNASCNGVLDGSMVFAPAVASHSYQWNDPQAQTTASANGLGAGTYTVIVTDALGCDTSLTASITQPQPLSATQVITTDVTCAGGSNGTVSLTIVGGTPAYSVSWSSGQTGASISGTSAGSYAASITDAQGCTAQATAVVTQPEPIVVSVEAPDTVCVNAPSQLSATATGGAGGYIFNWGGYGSNPTVQLGFPTSQTILLTVVDQAGCAGPTTPVAITVLDLNTANFDTYGDTTVCVGGMATVGATLANYPGPFNMAWSPLGYTGLGPFVVPINADQTLTVTVTDGCGNTLQRLIGLGLDIAPSFELPAIIAEGCAPLMVQYPTIDLGNVLYTWNLGNGTTSNVPAPQLIYQQGSYTASLTVTTPLGCTATSNSGGQINAYGSPTAAFTADPMTTSIDNAVVNFTNQSVGTIVSFSWTFGDGGTSVVMDPSYEFNEIGTFEADLFIEDENGCTASTSQIITIEPVYDVVIPTAFTPDPNGSGSGSAGGGNWVTGDLSNDVFYPFVRFVEDFRMRIFNRWGELIFESTDLKIGWDGYYRGQLSPQDVYVVQTWFRFVDGKQVEKLSDLTLFR